MVELNKRIVFISPSDIAKDSRILKQIAVAELSSFGILALGVKEHNNSHLNANKNIVSINLYSRNFNFNTKIVLLKFIINAIQGFFMTFEILIKFFPRIVRFKPHIVHCSDYTFLPITILLKSIMKTKIIYDVHELESQTTSISKLTSYYVFYLEKFIWPFIDVTLHVSESIRDWYEDKYGKNNSEIILNSPITKNNSQSGDYFRNVYKIPGEIKIFLYLGILGRGRGIETALRIFSKLESTAAIIFMGHGEKERQILDYSQKFSNIYHHPQVSHDEVVSIASSANFGYCVIENVSLSDYFCLPNKLFEYVFSGIPVLASKFPDISRIVSEFNLGILTDLDEPSIRDGINELLTNRHSRKFLDKDLYPLSWVFQSQKFSVILNGLSTD